MIRENLTQIASLAEGLQRKYEKKNSEMVTQEELTEIINGFSRLAGLAHIGVSGIDDALDIVKQYDRGGRYDLAGRILWRLMKKNNA
jgi:hypothetical protein